MKLLLISLQKCMLLIVLLCCSLLLPAQDAEYDQTIAEIEETLGTVPAFMKEVPDHMLPMAWEHFKSSNNPDNKIPQKYIELIKLSVSAQIPCQYCIVAHQLSAEAAGASETEIKEAVMHGAWVRQWSMLTQTTLMDVDAFKKEYKSIMSYMEAQSKN